MDKIFEKLLDDFKRANKARKQTLAKRYGFDTPEEYLAYLEGTKTSTAKKKSPKTKVSTDIVIAFDTTGSMASYISDVKKHVKSLIPDLFAKTENLKIKIVAFGDYCDMLSKDNFGNAYQECELTNNENELLNFVSTAKNTRGGDNDEFYELVIKKITEETKWRKDSNRSILLIADAGPHEVGYSYRNIIKDNQIDWKVEANNAKKMGIKIDTLGIHDRKWYKELSNITGGIHLKFQSANKTSVLLDGYTYARSGSDVSFATAASRSCVTSDPELSGAYKQMGELL